MPCITIYNMLFNTEFTLVQCRQAVKQWGHTPCIISFVTRYRHITVM